MHKIYKRPLVLIIIFSILLILYKDNKNINLNISNINNSKNTINNIDNKELLNHYRNFYDNTDIIGSLKISDDINTLFVQGKDNNFYLNHDLNKQYLKSGSVFLDYRININNSKKIILYGHNSNLDVPFKLLLNYFDEEYFNSNKYITLYLDNNTYLYKIFSVYTTVNNYEHMKLNFNNSSWLDHLSNIKELSLYKNDITFNNDDEIIILQTCVDLKTNKLLIVCGRKEK